MINKFEQIKLLDHLIKQYTIKANKHKLKEVKLLQKVKMLEKTKHLWSK